MLRSGSGKATLKRLQGTLPSLGFNFTSGVLDSRITFTRASTGTCFDSTGTLVTKAIDQPRFDYNPTTLSALGLLIEEQRTNSIRNNTMSGAAAGSPGTLPINWNYDKTAAQSTTLVGTGTENGIPYIDLRFFSAANDRGYFALFNEASNGSGVSAGASQAWNASVFIKLISGTVPGNVTNNIRPFSSAGVTVGTDTNASVTIPSTSLGSYRPSVTYTSTPVGTTLLTNFLLFAAIPIGPAYDFTVRIGAPQLELGAFATSVILTSTAAVTRQGDTLSISNLSPWFNSAGATIYTESDSANFGTGVQRLVASFENASGDDTVRIYYRSGTNGLAWEIRKATVTQVFIVNNGLAFNTMYKVAGSFAAGGTYSNAALGGVIGTASTGYTSPTVDRLYLGSALGNSAFLNGHLKVFQVFPQYRSDNTLVALTS